MTIRYTVAERCSRLNNECVLTVTSKHNVKSKLLFHW